MSIGVVDRKLLWGRSRNQCAFPRCTQRLTVDLRDPESEALSDAGAVLGEEAHIRSGRTEGPRYDPDYPVTDIDRYKNLILLCPTHHTLIDKDGGVAATASELEKMRDEHETAMHLHESQAEEAARVLSERTVAAIAVWEQRAMIADWQALTWGLNRPVPTINEARIRQLAACAEWLLAKDWPTEFPRLRVAFTRFFDAVRALSQLIGENFEVWHEDVYRLVREYKKIPWDPDRYDRLLRQFQVEATTTWALTAELSRAANLVIKATRSELDPLYRFEEGMLLAHDGDGILDNRLVRVEYTTDPTDDTERLPPLASLRAWIDETAAKAGVEPDDLDPYNPALVLLPTGESGPPS